MALLLAGCSAVKLAYNNLPDITYWWIDGYADLGEVQSVQLRNELARLQAWHRANELSPIAELLQQIQRDARNDTSAEAVCRFYDQLRARLEPLRLQAEPAAVTLALSLTQAQLRHIERRFEKGNAQWRREWLEIDPAQRLEKQLKAALDRAEQFYGTLDERQRAVLQAGLAGSRFDPQRSYRERLRRQQDLLQVLRTLGGSGGARPSATQAGAALQGVLQRFLQSPDPDYRSYAQATTLQACRTWARLHNGTSAEQRERAIARVAAYERDARELAHQ